MQYNKAKYVIGGDSYSDKTETGLLAEGKVF